MPIFTSCSISLRCPQNVSGKFQLKIPHRSFIIPYYTYIFERKADFVHVPLNANELLLPVTLSRRGRACTTPASNTLPKTNKLAVWFYYHLYRGHPLMILQFFIIIKVIICMRFKAISV